jgi:hypothetical protein
MTKTNKGAAIKGVFVFLSRRLSLSRVCCFCFVITDREREAEERRKGREGMETERLRNEWTFFPPLLFTTLCQNVSLSKSQRD